MKGPPEDLNSYRPWSRQKNRPADFVLVHAHIGAQASGIDKSNVRINDSPVDVGYPVAVGGGALAALRQIDISVGRLGYIADFLIEDFGKGIQDLVSQIDQSRVEVVGIVGIRGQPGGIRIHLDVSGIDNYFKDRGSVFDTESELGVGIGISEAGRLHIAEIP